MCDNCCKKLEEYDRICQQAAKIQDEISNNFKKTQQRISDSLSCFKLEVEDDTFDHDLVFFEANESDNDTKINPLECLYNCSICQEKFAKKKLYQSHMKFAHLPKEATIFSCADCAESLFISNLELQLHQNIFHSTDLSSKLFQCPACPKKFRTKSLINRHFGIHTSSDRPFVCEQCGKTFFHYSSFQAHIKVHNDERAFSCKLCPKTFRSQSHLNRHTKTHTKQKSHECSGIN